MWCIWKERNNRCFEDSERVIPDIKLLFFRTLLEWFSVWRNHSFSLLDLLDFCNFRFWFVLPCILPVCLGVSFLSMKSYYLSKKKEMFFFTFYFFLPPLWRLGGGVKLIPWFGALGCLKPVCYAHPCLRLKALAQAQWINCWVWTPRWSNNQN